MNFRLKLCFSILCCLPALSFTPLAGVTAEAGFRAFQISQTPVTLRSTETARRFIAAHGRRGMVVGYAGETLEGWVYPFRIFHDYRTTFQVQGSAEAVSGKAREVIVNPESVTEVYSGQGFTVRETLFVPLDEAGFLILYQVTSSLPLRIRIAFRPDLDLMWPGGMGGQSYGWDEHRHAFILQESSDRYSALVGSPVATDHSDPASYKRPWEADRTLSMGLDIPANTGDRMFPVIATLTAPPFYDASKTYDSLLERTSALYQEAVEHYRKLVASGVQLKTPDPKVNLAYIWARIALDQAYVCNPWLGCGLVAGYGPSRDTRRPQYAWFFGGDALINSLALEASGDHGLAREAIRFIQKFQNKKNGEIIHELSQSAGLMDWFKNYPYAYRHTDASAMYLVAFRDLLDASGDSDFFRESWSHLQAAYQYLLSRVDPSDGLVTVPPGGWGGDETINQPVAKDVYLESLWVAGAEAFEELARLKGSRELASDAHARAEKARASLAAKFWDPGRNFFYFGYSGRGQLLKQELSQPNWGIWLGSFDAGISRRALDHMESKQWQTAWGTRSVPSDDPLYLPESYGHGSVWPLGTGVQALAFYRYHRPADGEKLVRTLVDQTFFDSLGHVPEVFSGDAYRELDVSVPEQIWSSGMVITTLMRGLLGLQPDALTPELRWEPHLPRDWPGVTITNLQVGQTTLSMEMKQSATEITLDVKESGPPLSMTFAPQIPSGSEKVRAMLNGRPLNATIRSYHQDTHAETQFRITPQTEVVLNFEGGATHPRPQ
jgi:glycogen debranching enzyme